MSAHSDILRIVPNFPNYTFSTFNYPERTIQKRKDSVVQLGPPIYLYYEGRPHKNCQVHVSGIPDWACMADLVEIFERFGKLYSIEMSMCITPLSIDSPYSNGWAKVTYMNYAEAQNARFSHLTKRIPGSMNLLSIYKGSVTNVVLLKNLPAFESKAQIIEHINEFPGVLSISFLSPTTARVAFLDLDLALLFMDIVSTGGLVIQGFTCTVESVDEEEELENEIQVPSL